MVKQPNKEEKDVFPPGALVWAKMKGSPPWPGMVTNPTHLKKPKSSSNKVVCCIYFFGTSDYGWVENCNVVPYLLHKDFLQTKFKSATFKTGCQIIATYQKHLDEGKSIILADETSPVVIELLDSSNDEDPISNSSPEITVDSTLPEITVDSTLPEITVDSTLPEITVDSTLPEITIDSTLPAKTSIAITKRKNVQVIDDNYREGKSIKKPKRKQNGAELEERQILAMVMEVSAVEAPETDEARIGFVGLGSMGSVIVTRLLKHGYKISFWDSTAAECEELVKAGAVLEDTLLDVVERCFTTFLCASDSEEAKELVYGMDGLSGGIDSSKSLVNLTTIDPYTSSDISEDVLSKNGRYLEAQIIGGRTDASNGTLVIIAAGDSSLFLECNPIFKDIGKQSYFFDNIGGASKMALCLQAFIGGSFALLAEVMALADSLGLSPQNLVEILDKSSICSQLSVNKAQAMNNEETDIVDHPLQNLRKDLSLALAMAWGVNQPMPMTANANEIFNQSVRLGNGAKDSAAIYKNFKCEDS